MTIEDTAQAAKGDSRTRLRVVIYATEIGRFSWRLETEKGGHGVVVGSGTAYLTRNTAKQGARRFLGAYVREDAPIAWMGNPRR